MTTNPSLQQLWRKVVVSWWLRVQSSYSKPSCKARSSKYTGCQIPGAIFCASEGEPGCLNRCTTTKQQTKIKERKLVYRRQVEKLISSGESESESFVKYLVCEVLGPFWRWRHHVKQRLYFLINQHLCVCVCVFKTFLILYNSFCLFIIYFFLLQNLILFV